jgi:hypothetical protein
MRAAVARLFGLGIVLPILLGAWLATPGSLSRPTCALASGTHHVAVVVEHGNGTVLSRCVAFTEEQRTGEQIMQLSNIEYGMSSYGGGLGNAVCQVDGEPASYPPSCLTSTSAYWAMFVSRAGGRWSISNAGVSSQEFSDGDALGWHYVPPTGGGPPPSPAGVCATGAPAPAPVVTTAPAPAATAPAPAAPAASVASTADAGVTPTPPAPSPSASPHRAAPPAAPARPSAGWIVTAAGAGALVGLLILQLVRRLLQR